MIDTLTMQVNFTMDGCYYFLEGIRTKRRTYLELSKYNRGVKREDYCFVGGIAPYSLFFNASKYYLTIEFNPKLIIGRIPIADDVDNIEKHLKHFITNDLKIPAKDIGSITLNRIDYKIDYKIGCELELLIFYDLMKITPNNLNKVVKTLYDTALTYNPKHGYVEVIVYDKEMERKLAIQYRDYISSDEIDEDFRGVIRTEVRIKNAKLNYYKLNKKWRLSKELCNYLREDMKQYFFKQFAEKVWFSEPFYRIDVALDLIRSSPALKDNMKRKLCDVLKSIRRNGYSKARDNYGYWKKSNDIQKAISKGYSKEYIQTLEDKKLCSLDFSTFNNYIGKIRELGINPLTFSRNYDIEKIENFAKYKRDMK